MFSEGFEGGIDGELVTTLNTGFTLEAAAAVFTTDSHSGSLGAAALNRDDAAFLYYITTPDPLGGVGSTWAKMFPTTPVGPPLGGFAHIVGLTYSAILDIVAVQYVAATGAVRIAYYDDEANFVTEQALASISPAWHQFILTHTATQATIQIKDADGVVLYEHTVDIYTVAPIDGVGVIPWHPDGGVQMTVDDVTYTPAGEAPVAVLSEAWGVIPG